MSKGNNNKLDQPFQLGNKSVDKENIIVKYGLIQGSIYPLEKILPRISRRAQPLKYAGNNINLSSTKLMVFKKKGINCVKCGISGSYFSIDYPINGKKDYALNLYANVDGKHILMTRDHMMPKSRGGTDMLYNLEPMCIECNQNKKDGISFAVVLKYYVLKMRFDFRYYTSKLFYYLGRVFKDLGNEMREKNDEL